MSWEVFERKRGGPPTVTLQANGTAAINKTAAELLGNPKAVQLLYERGSGRIGIKAGRPGEGSAYIVTKAGTFSMARFCTVYGIQTSEKVRRYSATLESDVLAFDPANPLLGAQP